MARATIDQGKLGPIFGLVWRWLFFTVSFALMPLLVHVIVRSMTDPTPVDPLGKSPELLFFGLMVSSTSLGDLWKAKPLWGTADTLAKTILLGISVWSATFYGLQTFAVVVSQESPRAARFLTHSPDLCVMVAITGGIAALAVQIGLAISNGGNSD